MSLIAASQLHCRAEVTEREIKQHLEKAPRRTNRVTLLSLLATKPIQHLLNPSCGLYIASINPDEKNMQELLEAVCINKVPPKPFQFVNSVSNATGFYLAKELGLEGPNLFIGSNDEVWKNLIMLANLDLGRSVKQALLINCINYAESSIEVVLLEGALLGVEENSFELLAAQTPNFSQASI